MALSTRVGRTGRHIIRRIRDERALRGRQPPTLHVGARGTRAPAIYYLCPDNAAPAGGIRMIYRHVDLLNESGHNAVVLHHRDGFSCGWFEHSTPTAWAPSTRLSADDILVVPELHAPFVDRIPDGPRLICLNQGAYITFKYLPAPRTLSYDAFDAVLTVSPDSAEYLRFAFPGARVSIVDPAIDPAVFHPGSGLPPRQIAMMPRRRPEDAEHVLRLLGDRLSGWSIVSIAGASERETADLLRSSPIFLAFGKQEGFGLPAAEAMAAGSYVIGFSGFGGREIFDPAVSAPIEDGDVLAMARATAEVMALYKDDPGAVRELGARASERVLARYSMDRLRAGLADFYQGLL